MDTRKRDKRIEIRATEEERAEIDRARTLAGLDLTEFVLRSALVEARRMMADRTWFVLPREQLAAWEKLHEAPARNLPGLAALMARSSAVKE